MSVAENIKFPLREHARLDEKTMDIMARLSSSWSICPGSAT